jgi:epoxyqueuosine reductase QueG
MSDLNRELEALLREGGADLVGFADLREVPEAGLPFGVSVAIRLPPGIVRSIADGPNLPYYETYHDINARLDAIVTAGAEYLTNLGYRAKAQTTKAVVKLDENRTLLPHKTVATRAGLGWIGRSALLVTREYGPALRISSILTDAPLDAAKPVDESSCGDCGECIRHCPAGALVGGKWQLGLSRERLVDVGACSQTAKRLCRERFGIEATICGKCIEVCPFTRRYLRASE